MHSGISYWMMNSSMHGFMALLSNVVMGLNTASILDLHILCRLSGKVSYLFTLYNIVTDHRINRVLLASIRNKCKCPCLRCLIPLSNAYQVGTLSDCNKCMTLAQIDNPAYCPSMVTARDIIHNRGFAVDCNTVEELLGKESLVPTKVS